MTVLLINASIRDEESISRELSKKLADKLLPPTDGKLIVRDLRADMHFITEQSFSAAQVPTEDRTASQQQLVQRADEMIGELMEADTIVFGAPVYNFGPPASLKAWADLVARAGTTFQYTPSGPEGLLRNKKAYVVAVSGGTTIGGDMDFMSTWLTFFLGFLGIPVAKMVVADGIMGQDGERRIQAAHQVIEAL